MLLQSSQVMDLLAILAPVPKQHWQHGGGGRQRDLYLNIVIGFIYMYMFVMLLSISEHSMLLREMAKGLL